VTTPLRISHYEVLERIGRDGPTEIYRARDGRLERDVALKLLRPEALAEPGGLERFRREARIASLVTHPHICTVHDSGEQDGRAFLVCELLDGRALDETVKAEGAFAPDRVIELGIQLADALVAAHRRGIVHANLKPSNVFITTDGHVKLLELGAAGAAASSDQGHSYARTGESHTTSVAPVPAIPASFGGDFFHPYLSPEQVNGLHADTRSDVFAAGALLYEMATGVPAFGGDTLAGIASEINGKVPAPPRRRRHGIPAALEATIMRALEKAPERRFQRASDLLDDLRRARRAFDRQANSTSWFGSRGRTAAFAAGLLAVVALVGSARWW